MDLKEFKGLPKSFWIASTGRTNYPKLEEDIEVDLAIVGGGMVGISTAYQLRESGLDIGILDAGGILMSTTAHTTAKITSQHGLIYQKIKSKFNKDMAEGYAKANEFAIELVEKIITKHKIDCDFERQAAYIYTQEDKYIKKIEKETDLAISLGLPASYLDDIPLNIPIKAAMRFDDQAQFHPRKFLLALADIIHQDGIKIYEHSRVIGLEEDGESFILLTSQGKRVKANKVIIASHYPFYNKESIYFARLYVERSYVLALKANEKYPGGMYISAEDPVRSLRAQDSNEGQLIFVIGEKHKTGQGEDTNIHYENLIDFAQGLFTIEDIPYRWSTQDCMTMDNLPYIGQYSKDYPNLYIATGFQKWGMTNSMVASILLKDLITKGESPWQQVYDPSRKSVAASAKDFVVENINVAGQLIDGKLSKLPDQIKIKPGEGQTFKYKGERIGAFRDDRGKLHFVDTTCTHLGCELNWNSAERSWDCPCHGSRFTYEGKIIQGPAVKDLSFDKDTNILTKLIKEDF